MARLRSVGVRTKIIGVVAVAGLAAIIVGIFGITAAGTVYDRGNDIYRQGMVPASEVAKIRESVFHFRLDALSAATAGTTDGKQLATAAANVDQQELNDTVASYQARKLSSAERSALNDFTADWAQYLQYKAQADKARAEGRLADFDALKTEKINPIASAAALALDKLSAASDAAAQAEVRDARNTYSVARTVGIVLLVVGLAVAGGLALLIARSIVRPLRRVRDVLDAVAEGDLSRDADVTSGDEVGRMAASLGRATQRMREAVRALEVDGARLDQRSRDLAGASDALAGAMAESASQIAVVETAADEVSRSVQTVATGAEEMGASIREIARNATDAVQVAGQAVSVASSAEETMGRLGTSSAEIGEVIKVITSIAEQTNLLALNATIEAARAGDAGKGFAVVAGEVKDLAQETAKATDEIGRRINAIQSDATGAVSAIAEITKVISQINNYQTTIASAVEEQTATTNSMSETLSDAAGGAGNIRDGLARAVALAESTQSGAATTRETAGELAQISSAMREIVGQFRHRSRRRHPVGSREAVRPGALPRAPAGLPCLR